MKPNGFRDLAPRDRVVRRPTAAGARAWRR